MAGTCGGDYTMAAGDGDDGAAGFTLPSELKSLGLGSYDEAIKQIVNIGTVVAIVYVVLAGVQYVMPDISTDLMNNKVRTSMLAAVVLPILMQQIRNLITKGADMKVGRNVAVAAILAYVLLFQSASDLIGPRLFDGPMDMIGGGSNAAIGMGMRRPMMPRPAMPVSMPPATGSSSYMRGY